MRIFTLTVALFIGLTAQAQAAPRESFEARVVGVSDGDTITVRVSNTPPYTIRLAGIDAPEKGQAFGDRSKKNLSGLVYDHTVQVEWSKKDGYGRIVGKVSMAGLDVNLAQITSGLAWHYKQYEREQSKQDRQAYGTAEQKAREQMLGLWKDPKPVPPWEWRHPNTSAPTAGSAVGPVRKSQNKICHDSSSPAYRSLKKFTSYPTLEECVASGARLPRKPAH